MVSTTEDAASISPAVMDLRVAVQTAPLWMPTPQWSSRSIAESVGVSQSYVARVWRESAATDAAACAAQELTRILAERRMRLGGLIVTDTGSCVVLILDDPPGRQPDTVLPRRRLHAVRTLLAADLARPLHGDPDAVALFWRAMEGAGAPTSGAVAITSGDVAVPPDLVPTVLAAGAAGWQFLFDALHRISATGLPDLELRLRRWYAPERAAFTWVPAGARGAPRMPTSVTRTSARERALADDILLAVRAGLADGRFVAGDDVTERTLAQLVHAGRSRVHQALLLLADEGLIAPSTRGAMVVRIPAVIDVVELYAARRALGAIAIRAAGRWTRDDRDAVAAPLADLTRCVDRDEVDLAQIADLAFQNALARSTGLTRIPGMLESLSQQLLMYISVLGVRYAFAPTRILAHDTAIFDAVDTRRYDDAVAMWQGKMDEGQRYMLEQMDLLLGRRRIR